MRLAVVLLSSAACSVFATLVVMRAHSFATEDLDGFIYLYLATPLAASAAALIIWLGWARRGTLRRDVSAIALVLAMGTAVHVAGIRFRFMPGYYELPAGMDFGAMTVEELAEALSDRNNEVASAALHGLARRGPEGSAALLAAIDAARRRMGRAYLDDHGVMAAVRALAELRDERVKPVLLEMLTSTQSDVMTRRSSSGSTETLHVTMTRVHAAELLERHFGESVNAERIRSSDDVGPDKSR